MALLNCDINLNIVCRACGMAKSDFLEPIFSNYLAEMFITCTSLKISKDDSLPQRICLACKQLLESSYKFRLQCQISDTSFHSYQASTIKVNTEKRLTSSTGDKIKLKNDTHSDVFVKLKTDGDFHCTYYEADNISPSPTLLFTTQIIDSDSVESNCDIKTEMFLQTTKTEEIHMKTNKNTQKYKHKYGNLKNISNPGKKCAMCNKTFVYFASLVKHEQSCRRETSEIKSSSDVVRKLSLPIPDKAHCGLCEAQFKNIAYLNEHLEIHKKEKHLLCKICSYTGIDWADFLCHRYTHQPEGFRKVINCWTCTNRFKNVERLEFHIRKDHLGKRPGICKICHKEFMNIKNWRAHKLNHTGAKPSQCKICNKSFVYTRSLVLHMRCHSDVKKYVCHICGIAFKFHTGLTSHQFRIHSSVQPLVCSHCGKTFKNSETLREHLLRVTGARNFACADCGKNFRSPKELQQHERWHSPDKPFPCTYCGKRYKAGSHLASHLRQHTGERPYRCDVCNKTFMTSSVLKKHRMTHTGEKPHSCHVCGKAFIEKSNLKSHLKTHKQVP